MTLVGCDQQFVRITGLAEWQMLALLWLPSIVEILLVVGVVVVSVVAWRGVMSWRQASRIAVLEAENAELARRLAELVG